MVPDVRTNITYHLEQLLFSKLCLKTLLYSHSPPKTRSGTGEGRGVLNDFDGVSDTSTIMGLKTDEELVQE